MPVHGRERVLFEVFPVGNQTVQLYAGCYFGKFLFIKSGCIDVKYLDGKLINILYSNIQRHRIARFEIFFICGK